LPGAFALFYALFLPKPANNEEGSIARQHRIAGDGYRHWLATSARIQVVSFERYNSLARRSAGETGNILIATLPQQLPAVPMSWRRWTWLARDNSLLILAA
jgi:hypothetical protein